MDFGALPEDCFAAILSRTSPIDVCRLSSVSKLFHSTADSDAVWSHFLPSDSNFSSIISQSPLLANSPSKKALYLALSDQPIIIHHGKQSFQLDRKSGKKCYMLGARALAIVWGDTPEYWNWITMPDSRFQDVARLVSVCWFDIQGKMNTLALSPNTLYAVFLVFKLIDAHGFYYRPAEVSVCLLGGENSTKMVCLDSNVSSDPRLGGYFVDRVVEMFNGLERPQVRSDGWLEIEMGEFFNSDQEDELQVSVTERTNGWKYCFFLQGIEIRPKN